VVRGPTIDKGLVQSGKQFNSGFARGTVLFDQSDSGANDRKLEVRKGRRQDEERKIRIRK